MSQIPNSSASSENNNVPPAPVVWNNPAYESNQMYSNQFVNQHYSNWAYGGYPQNMPFIPPTQVPVVQSNQQPSTILGNQAVKRSSESDDEENDENEPPKKSPKVDYGGKYLNLDSSPQSNYTNFLSTPMLPTSFAQSTPKMSVPYAGPNFNTPSQQINLFCGYNPMLAQTFPYMPHQLHGSYANSPYSPQLLSSQHFSSDTGIHGMSSGLDSASSGSMNHSNTNSSDGLQVDNTKEPPFLVPGRLALLNSNQKYAISIGEVNRRLGAPENMNTSLLGAMLRRAKNKDGGKGLREKLRMYDINMPEGRRRSLENTAFTALCEAEALNLARDLGHVLQQYFPTKLVLIEIALTIQRNYMQSGPQAQSFFQLLEDVVNSDGDVERQTNCIVDLLLHIMDTVCSVLERDCSLVDMGIEVPRIGAQPLPTELQKGLYDFNLVTHNFGVKSILAAYRSLSSQPGDDSKTSTSDLGISCESV
ncbi:Transcription factor AP-2-beta-like [Aphelenchoides bicaudatus]|nr:Transcription factor AP-2-beta-like [Aphelenchoides bicaudatus]